MSPRRTPKTRPKLSGGSQEEGLLKMGYYNMLMARHPFNDSLQASLSEMDAYTLSLEKEYLPISPEYDFHDLKDQIPEKHRERLEEIWETLTQLESTRDGHASSLKRIWTSRVPALPRQRKGRGKKGARTRGSSWINAAFENPHITPPLRYRNAVKTSLFRERRRSQKIQAWQTSEKGARYAFYYANKSYITTYRLYLAMLLERNQDQTECVLPEDHPLRTQIKIHLRYLEVLDAFIHGMAASKAAHHQQEKKRTRKTNDAPFIEHSQAVTQAMKIDVVPFVIEEERMSINLVLLTAALPMHDAPEDTELTVNDVINALIVLVDTYDSKVIPRLKSGFGLDRDTLKKKVLNLMGESNIRTARHVLRIMTNDEEMTNIEKKRAAIANIAGKKGTSRALELGKNQYKGWGIDQADSLEPQHKTYEKFPIKYDTDDHAQEHDGGKLTNFLIRLHGITESETTRQAALIFKLEDRAHNISTLPGMPIAKQLSNLRSTTTRLLAHCILDHDNNSFPLYNALPRCLDETLKGYQRLQAEGCAELEDYDQTYIAQLEEWQREVIRLQLPAKVQAVLDEYNTPLAA